MSYRIIISTAAAKDLQKSFEWYESLSAGLGFRFVEFVDKVLAILELYPESFPLKKDSFREASIKRFPYLVVYEYSSENQMIYILHFFNSRQHPKKKYRKIR